MIGSSLVLAGPLYLNGVNIMTTIAANAGSSLGASTQLSVASLSCSGDVQARDVVATRELHADGAAVLNSTLTVAGATTITGTLTVGGSNLATAIAAKQNALTTSSALSVATLMFEASCATCCTYFVK